MNIGEFIQDKFLDILSWIGFLLFVGIFLLLTGTGLSELILVLVIWAVVYITKLVFVYKRTNAKLLEINRTINEIDQKYLFIEMTKRPGTNLGKKYYTFMRTALVSMTEYVSRANRENTNYRQYIEQWTHEIKRPAAAIELLCENNKSEFTSKIRLQAENIERYVEQILYYARLGYTEKDYVITEISLKQIVDEALDKNKLLLIYNDIKIETNDLECNVYSDKKWIIFILGQIIANSVQYKKENARLHFFAEQNKEYVSLHIKDNGIGIKESEVSRIFEYGFTGTNGRTTGNSTGMGLYLCKQITEKLGIEIKVFSIFDQYTDVVLVLPINNTVILQKQF